MEGSIWKAQIEFIRSLCGICIVQLNLLTEDRMALFPRRDSKGLGAVSTYPRVKKIKGGEFEAACLQGELEQGEVHTCRAICIDEPIFRRMLVTPYLPRRHCCGS